MRRFLAAVDGTTVCAHKSVVASLVGAVPMVLDWGPQRPADGDATSEAEWRALQRLLPRLRRAFHHQIDVVVADAAYCTRPFLPAILVAGWEAVVRIKNTRLSIWQDALGLCTRRPRCSGGRVGGRP